jgi:hypothetical protein
MSTRVMDRRSLPPMSAVVPVARSTSPLALVPSPSARPNPPAFVAPSADTTQPSRLRRRETTLYRRLAITLGIAFAFACGLAASFAVQASSVASAPAQLRQPRAALTRSASFRLLDGSDTKLGARDARDVREEGPAAVPARPARRTAAGGASSPRAAAVAAAPEESRTPDVAPSELLDKGLTAD